MTSSIGDGASPLRPKPNYTGRVTAPTREEHLLATFVTLADSLVADYDIVELLQALVEECTALFDAADAGILLVNNRHDLEVIVSTSERSELVGLMQLRAGEGPCVEAITMGRVVSVANFDEIEERWPKFAHTARRLHYKAIHAIPLRLRDTTIGSLKLFRTHNGDLNAADSAAAQALGDVATISILQERSIRESDVARAQLQRALDSRILIEQAKGYLAHTQNVDMDTAFAMIRQHARSTQTRLSEVAARIVAGTLKLES